MRSLRFALFAVLVACTGADKEDAKGQVDESEPPSIPTESGKSDSSAKLVSVNVQSPHPYVNNHNKVYPVSLTTLPFCAKNARLHFKVLRTESGYDYVTVEPVGGTHQEFSGDRDNTWSEWFQINSTKVDVRLESDYSVTRHGFEVDQIEWSGTPDNCPIGGWPPCNASSHVNVAAPPGTCECPVAPVCAPLAGVEVSHHLARGFNNTTKRAIGNVAEYTHPGPADGPETETWGTIDQVRLGQLVRRAADLGLLHGQGYTRPFGGALTLDEFSIKAGAFEVMFSAAQGGHDANVQALIDDFEALFGCDSGGGVTCGSGWTCETNSCVEVQSCICPALYDPQCGTNGQTYGNACEAGCANVPVAHDGECGTPGDTCGTMMGLSCSGDNRCRFAPSTFTYPYPDAGGVCVAPNYCDAPADCNHLPHIAVPGAWACNANACAWQTGPVWKQVTSGHFETANPYTNNMSVWKEIYLPAEAQFVRLSATRFRTEANYDKLELWTWRNGAWVKVKTWTGSTGPALTEEFAGRYHYLRFVSDSSVTASGISLDAQWR